MEVEEGKWHQIPTPYRHNKAEVIEQLEDWQSLNPDIGFRMKEYQDET